MQHILPSPLHTAQLNRAPAHPFLSYRLYPTLASTYTTLSTLHDPSQPSLSYLTLPCPITPYTAVALSLPYPTLLDKPFLRQSPYPILPYSTITRLHSTQPSHPHFPIYYEWLIYLWYFVVLWYS